MGDQPTEPLNHRRRDIQGLRALAVIGVLAFHARLPLPGGFAGVDVFFVISGYVITNMLLREWRRSNRISLSLFWKRRFLRLTPALALLIAFTLLAAGVIMYPDEQRVALQTGVAALLLSANIVIARNTGGYFDLPAESNPLLNTWSLSIEEQFYLIFPLILILGWYLSTRTRYLRHTNLAFIAALIVVSLGLALVAGGELINIAAPTWLNFYSPITRAWEFAVGSFIALAATGFTFRTKPVSTALRFAGLLMILSTYLFISSGTPWPGLWTVLPVVGATLVLLAGQTSERNSGQLLASRAAVKVGDWSYSIYLWHWPFIVFALAVGFTGSLSLVFAVVLSLVPALASYTWVEQTLRSKRTPLTSNKRVLLAATLMAPILGGIVMVTALKPTIEYPTDVGTSYLTYIDENTYPCTNNMGIDSSARCRQTAPEGSPSVVILGDSHGEHLVPGFLSKFPNVNIQYLYLPDWPYVPSEQQDQIIAHVAQTPEVRTVVVGVRWVPEVMRTEEYLAGEIDLLTSAGKQVILTNDNPYFDFDARECKYERTFLSDHGCEQSSQSFNDLTELVNPVLDRLAKNPRVHLIDTSSGFCNEDTCSMLIDGKLAIADRGHLTVDGSRSIISRVKQDDPTFRSLIEGIS